MKVFLLYSDRDFDLRPMAKSHEEALVQDLELRTLFAAMSGGDKVLAEAAEKIVLAACTDVAAIKYRQDVLSDCLENEAVVRDVYKLAGEAIEAEKKEFSWGLRYPESILRRSLKVLDMLTGVLRRLRLVAEEHVGAFRSEGFGNLLRMVVHELDDEYLATVRRHLKQLRLERGVLVSARLGEGNRGLDYVLRKPHRPDDWFSRIFGPTPLAYSYRLPDRDESGAKALSELRDRGVNLIANALAQSADHILSFFSMLRFELAFYIGCVNLHRRLSACGMPVCIPEPAAATDRRQSATGLYNVCLALNLKGRVAGSRLAADEKTLVIVTGANQGGKSTFLRSLGLSQLMMQCGMFVGAEAFHASVCNGLFTHFKREEDASMSSGKFDEELKRMSDIVDSLTPGCLLLFNESFASTNEREGSEVGRQIVAALMERRIKVVFVTHQYEFAHGFEVSGRSDVLFLRAERRADGARTFKIEDGEPLRTSYGEDLYQKIFEDCSGL